MTTLDKIMKESEGLTIQQLREILAMAKGMDAANKLNQERGA